MPIANVQDAREVDRSIQNILAAPNLDEQLRTIRSLFVEVLDFERADQRVSLESGIGRQHPTTQGRPHSCPARRHRRGIYPNDNAPTNRITSEEHAWLLRNATE